LQGMYQRTIRMINNGIKPVFVFDGKPPELKSAEVQPLPQPPLTIQLAKRTEKRKEAEEGKEQAKEAGDAEALAKFSKRTVKVTNKHKEDCKKLLTLMGVPVVDAPSEAEAQCAAMVKHGICFATGTEDMDALTFGTSVLLRHLTFSEARKMPIREIHLSKVLEELSFTQDQFIDLCILLGCDYCDSIRGIGPVRALDLMRKHGSLEEVIKHLDSKYTVPESFDYVSVRKLFKDPEVTDPEKLEVKWSDPDEDGLIQFLVKEKGFNEERVRNGIQKLNKARNTSVQGRLTSFFGEPTVVKRKVAFYKI
jgi:flap endonuclease-1